MIDVIQLVNSKTYEKNKFSHESISQLNDKHIWINTKNLKKLYFIRRTELQ